MTTFHLKPYISVEEYSILFSGNKIYDFESSLKVYPSPRKTDYSGSKWNSLCLDTHHIPLSWNSILLNNEKVSGFYCYFLAPRIRSHRLSPKVVSEISEIFIKRLNTKLTKVLSKLVELLSISYTNIITDIPGIGGIYIGGIYNKYPELFSASYSECVDANLYKILIEELHLNLDKLSGTTIVLLSHNQELAYDISTLIPRPSVPVVLLGR